MHMKVLVSFVSAVLMVVVGFVGVKNFEVDKSYVGNEVEVAKDEIQNVTVDTQNKVENNLESTPTNEAENVLESNNEQKNDEQVKVSETKANNQNQKVDSSNKKVNVASSSTAKVEETSPVSKPQTQTQITPEPPKKEEPKPETKPQVTEEYIYNSTQTQKIISDINTIAKRNPSLWGANGEKLYKVEISSSIKNKNYMSPYKFSQVEGIVLNVFPVKFLVYAEDYKKTGYETTTRYYVDVTNY